jgi:hypothetical protein
MSLKRKTSPRLNGPRERSFGMTEELTLHQIATTKIRLIVNEAPRASRRALMDQSSTQSLARARLSENENWLLSSSDESDPIPQPSHRFAAPNQRRRGRILLPPARFIERSTKLRVGGRVNDDRSHMFRIRGLFDETRGAKLERPYPV